MKFRVEPVVTTQFSESGSDQAHENLLAAVSGAGSFLQFLLDYIGLDALHLAITRIGM
jgi:hypothetical protein